MREQYDQDHFMGKKINCKKNAPCLATILEALYILTYECSRAVQSPRGFHVRFRLSPHVKISTISARIATFYKRKSNYIPTRVLSTELDPQEDSRHHHMAIILNGKYDRISSLQHIMAELQSGGFIKDYKVIAPTIDKFGQDLMTESGRDRYFGWLSYIAKTATKNLKRQTWSSCRTVTEKLKNWRANGRPYLTSRDGISTSPPAPLEAILECFNDTPATPLLGSRKAYQNRVAGHNAASINNGL